MAKAKLHLVSCSLTKTQVSALMAGKPVKLLPRHIMGNKHKLALSARLAKSMQGGSLHMTNAELEASGLKEIWQSIKSGAKKAKNFYDKNLKSVLGPILKKGVQSAIIGSEALLASSFPAYAPQIAMASAKYNSSIVDKLGELSHAYGLKEVMLHLTGPQARKLHNGKMVQLNASALSGGNVCVSMMPNNHKKVMSAKRLNKGVRLQLSDIAREHSGEGLKEVYQKAKALYKEHVKPHAGKFIKKNVEKVIERGFSELKKKAPKYSKEIDQVHDRYAPALVDKIGAYSEAYGQFGGDLSHDNHAMVVYSSQKGPDARLPVPSGASLRTPVHIHHHHYGGSFKASGFNAS